jgi:hypothetical protein
VRVRLISIVSRTSIAFSLLLAAVACGQAAAPPPSPEASAATIVYRNAQYDFCFALPASWQGYTILSGQWNGSVLSSGQVIHGPQLRIRHPKWTQENPYEDIPIMVFTHKEWQKVVNVEISVSGAPMGPSELGRNHRYVFALPPRYNFDFATGWQEVEDLISHKSFAAPCAATGNQP